ncbi:MAG: response regulator transcription factor [Bowdeniella nasicola]|nr:response regulator transcription factor [Bowdeniella nasicola]
MRSEMITVGLVEDHTLMRMGVENLLRNVDRITYVGGYSSLDELEANGPMPDILLLDLRLQDGSTPADNVSRAKAAGAKVLVYTSAEDPYNVRVACQAGAVGVVRKSDTDQLLVRAICDLADGSEVAGMDWATALDSDEEFVSATLTKAERRVLEEYACGLTSRQVARKLGLSIHTVNSYVRDIRAKYEEAGRDARSRVDLYIHAVRDALAPGPGALQEFQHP